MKILNKNKKKKGFTLIELVAVVAIIGILAALLVPKITGYMNEAKKTKVIDQARKVVMAVDTYQMRRDTTFKGKTVGDVLSNTSTKEYLGGDGVTLDNTLPNLIDTMTVVDCRAIVENNSDFKLGKGDKFSELIATTTPPSQQE